MANENTLVVLPENMHQCIAAQDFAENPQTHISEIRGFASTYGLSYKQAVSYMLEPDEDSSDDAVEDYLERRGFVLESSSLHMSTQTSEVFKSDNPNDPDALAAVEWAKSQYVDFIHNERFWKVGTKLENFAGATRGSLTDALNRGTVGEVAPTAVIAGDIELADIIARRVPIRGNKYIAPKVDKPKNYKLTGIAELADIPTWKMTTGEDSVTTLKAGYGTQISYEMLRADGESMESLALFARMLAFETLQEIVNRGIKLIVDTAGALYKTGSTALTKKEYIALVGRRKAGTTYNTVIGSLQFMAEYLGVDLSYASDVQQAGIGARTLIEALVGAQRLGIRESTEVSSFDAKKGVLFDRRFMIEYIFELGGDIEEEDRQASNQMIAFYNTFNFAFQKTAYADDAKATYASVESP